MPACPYCTDPTEFALDGSPAACQRCGRPAASSRGPFRHAKGGTSVVLAAPPRPSRFRAAEADTDADLSRAAENLAKAFVVAPGELGQPHVPGYRLEAVLGRGGMGTVYRAQQESLDRPVALKVMSRRWANDPVFLARFTREAYAAAQLNHPNIVQIYDIGNVDGTRYFSMEYVPGRSLADVVRLQGKLDPETAVGYILQAARGLKHAHDRGMVHRDIKPDNLLLSEQGIVKVADLGLVKTPDLLPRDDRPASESGLHALPKGMTGVRMALGTPAYMSPEQCRDAAMVDHRADIYSLGCTLYVLVTGQPPFDADTAVELMSKQAYQPLVPPDEIVNRVPKELSAVIQKMLAKHADERFPHMGEVVRTLEEWLGVHHTGTFSPREDQIASLEGCVRAFATAPSAVFRERVVTGFLSACLLAAVILTVFGRLSAAFGTAGTVVLAAAVYFVLAGAARKHYFFRRVNQFVSGMTVGDWLVFAAGLALFGVLLWVLKLFWIFVGAGLVGAGLAMARRIALDHAAEVERFAAIKNCEQLLRRLRAQGQDEASLRQFVAKYGGRHWEEFFESLFGYEAKLFARALLSRGSHGGEREKFAAWREPVLTFMGRVEKSRREARERKILIATEQARLEAAGVSARAARQRAEKAAIELVRQASAIRSAESGRHAVPLPDVSALLAEPPAEDDPSDAMLFLAHLWLGGHVRALFAAVLLGVCGAWTVQNALLDAEHATLAASALRGEGTGFRTDPLRVPGIAPEFTEWADTANTGWAGVLLLASLFYRGHRMGALVVVGAVVTVFGHRWGIRTVEPIRDYHVALVLGTLLCLVGYRFGRR